MLKDLLRPNDFFTKFNLKDAYLTLPIWIHHKKFLRFIWRDTLWEFACLPFGLASAPCTFSKLLKPVVAQLRKMGIKLIIYLDDMLIMAASRDVAIEPTTITVNLFSSLGFVLIEGKCVLVPSRELEFVGCLENSVTMSLYLPRDKVKSMKRECQSMVNNPSVAIRTLSRPLGKLSTSIQAVFPALPFSFDGVNNGFEENSKLRIHTLSESGSSRRPPVVERSLSCMERQIPLEKERRYVHRDRCFHPRLGCVLQWGKNRGKLVSSGTPSAHKLLRINGGRFCNKILLQKQSLNLRKVVDGQYHCHSLHHPNGGLIHCASQSSLRDLATVFQREISLTAH